MRIVLGAAGFIGFHLTNSLVDAGEEVIAIDNFNDLVYSSKPKKARAELLAARGVTVVDPKADNSFWLSRLSSEDTVFNLAATPGLSPSWLNPVEYFRNNTLLVAEILQTVARTSSPPILVQASTSSVYGEYATGDIKQIKSPSSPYGHSKLAAENLLRVFGLEYGLKVRVLRLFSVFGPHQRPDQFFAIAMKKIANGEEIGVFGDGENRRTNVFVDDAVQAFLMASAVSQDYLECDIAGRESVSTLEVIQQVSSRMGRTAKIVFQDQRPGDQRETTGDLSSALNAMKWEPTTSFSSGLDLTVEHFRKNPEFY